MVRRMVHGRRAGRSADEYGRTIGEAEVLDVDERDRAVRRTSAVVVDGPAMRTRHLGDVEMGAGTVENRHVDAAAAFEQVVTVAGFEDVGVAAAMDRVVSAAYLEDVARTGNPNNAIVGCILSEVEDKGLIQPAEV